MAENQAVQSVPLSAKKALYVKYRLTEPIKLILWLLSTGVQCESKAFSNNSAHLWSQALQSSDMWTENNLSATFSAGVGIKC